MQRYSTTSIVLHWLIAILIIAAFAMGWYMSDLKISPTKLKLYAWHKWLGVSIFGLVAFRLLIRLIKGVPDYPDTMRAREKQLSNIMHSLLYVLMFAVPLSGYLYTYAAGFPVVYLGFLELPAIISPHPEWKENLKELHEMLTTGMLVLVGIHFAAALKHHLINKDGILQRMLPARFIKE